MSTLLGFIRNHPLPAYFVLAFAISWGSVLWVVGGPGGMPGAPDQFERLIGSVVMAMLLGPSVAGLAMTGVMGGRAGFRDLLARLRHWRVDARWYAIALLTAPIVVTATLYALSRGSPVYLPGIVTTGDRAVLLMMAIPFGIAAGLFEEIGWTGFAIPRMRARFGVLATGLILGTLWGAWHFITSYWASSESSSGVPLALYLAGMLFSFLIAFRVLMVWVYDRTQSLPLAMLMHTSLTTSVILMDPRPISGVPLVTYNLVLGAAFWLVVAGVAIANHGRLTRPALRKRMA